MNVEPSAEPVVERPLEDPGEIARQREERASRRLKQTVRDMVLSMLVVSGVVLVLVFPWNRGTPDPVRAVDVTAVVTGARATETWPVLAPHGLSAGWRATSARITTAADGQDIVHLGYVSPAITYVGLEQSATKVLSFVSEASVQGEQVGTEEISGKTWTKLESSDGLHRALVRTGDGATYVVNGSADWPTMETFTRSLVPG